MPKKTPLHFPPQGQVGKKIYDATYKLGLKDCENRLNSWDGTGQFPVVQARAIKDYTQKIIKRLEQGLYPPNPPKELSAELALNIVETVETMFHQALLEVVAQIKDVSNLLQYQDVIKAFETTT